MRLFFIFCLLNVFPFMINAQEIIHSDLWQVDSLLKTIYSNDAPGISIAILQKRNPVFKKNYGLADMETKEKISSITNFNIGSLTKQFTAMGILQLAEKKKLSLNDHLRKFFQDFNKKVANKITIKELLTHSSGIIDHYDYSDTKNMKHAHDADVLNAVRNIDTTYFEPGTHYRYSNTAYCLLALIIEKASGMSYPDYIKKNVFQPLGMNNTFVWNENEIIPDKANGYEYNDSTKNFARSGADESIFFSTEGDGGICTSINDYLKWINALQAKKIFSKENINMARSPHFTIRQEKKLSYGYGWFIDESSIFKKVYHSGSNGGFRAFSFSIPEEEYIVVIFSNRADINLEKLVLEINKILRPKLKPFAGLETFISFQDCSSIFAACKKIHRFLISSIRNWNASAMALN
jgi:CubicO group peptidase (beta-lactamase class C family)